MSALVDWSALLAEEGVKALIDLAIREDLADRGDVTTDSIFESPKHARARIVARLDTVACGLPLARAVLGRFDAEATWEAPAKEGAVCAAGETLVTIGSDLRALLAAERTMLNFVMRLCGIAMNAHRAAAAVPDDCRARIFDTRKTTPGWRLLEKAAVRTGGAQNHRTGLFDAVLIKDNHVAAAGSVRETVVRARSKTDLLVEVEIDRLEQLDEAIGAGPDIILLDNFALADIRAAVERTPENIELEVSGGVTLETIPEIARTGVHRISMGALTHTVRPADLSLELG